MKSTKVSFFQAIAISFGAIIGWGAYVMPGDLFLSKGTLLSSSLAIILGTILIYIIAQSYVNLLSITPDNESGGVYWIYKYLNNKHAFIYSWGMLLGYISIISLNISAIPLLIKYLLPSSFRFAFLYTFSGWDVYVSDIFICTLILVLFLFLNYKGIKKGVKFQTFFAILMVCSILILFLGSIINNDSRKEINYISEFNSIKNYLWMSIIAVVPWAFVGFETTPQISRDIKNSKQKSVLIISISIFFGLLFYLMINYITALNMDLNYNDITQSAWATGDGIKNKLGITGMSILSIAMILSILSGINGFILASIKLLESMSKFEIVPEYLLENNRFSNKKSIIFIFYLCVFIPWLGRNILLDIASIASIGISIGFLYVTISDIRSQYELYGKVSKKLSYIAVIISITFIALLLVPGSPAALSSRSIFLLSIFLVLSVGIFSIKKIIRN